MRYGATNKRLYNIFRGVVSKTQFDDDDEEELIEPDDTPAPPEKLLSFAAAIAHAHPEIDPKDALSFLIFHPHGRSLAAQMNDMTKRKEPPMTSVADVVKAHGGLGQIAKRITSENTSHGITEHEFSDMLMAEAKTQKRAGESDAQAFSRYYNDPANVEMRRAHMITKGWSFR
jgi:hypothetical protein